MERNNFKKAISVPVRKFLIELFQDNSKRLELLYQTAAPQFDESQVSDFEEFIRQAGFKEFIEKRNMISEGRFADLLEKLLKRVALEIPAVVIGEITGLMTSADYRKIEKSFFFYPVDSITLRQYQDGFIRVGEQNRELLTAYNAFYQTDEFLYLKKDYRDQIEIWSDMLSRLTDLLLARKNLKNVEQAAGSLSNAHVRRLIQISIDEKKQKEFILNIFGVFHHHTEPDRIIRLIAGMARYYSTKQNSFLFKRITALWSFFQELPGDRENDFYQFVKQYGSSRDELSLFVWEAVFELETEKAVQAMSFFTSTQFSTIFGHYGGDAAMIKMLVKNILTAILEIGIEGFNGKLYSLVLKLLLGLKMDRNFIRRRAVFFKWLKEKSSSRRIELQVIRFLFFEYIYTALKLVDQSPDLRMNRFCDSEHQLFCDKIDIQYRKLRSRSGNELLDLFKPVLETLRNIIWKDTREKFSSQPVRIEEIISSAVSLDREDQVIDALTEVEPEYLISYHESFMDIFRKNPEKIHEAISSDFWYRVGFIQALPHARGIIIPLVGNVNVLEGESGAYTDGRAIFLPSFVNYFKDPLDPLDDNRNLTVYAGLALHEAGHILAGSFRFNYWYYLTKLERPDLFKYIHNVIEDYRIEKFLIRINAHPQAAEILNTIEEYFAVKDIKTVRPLAEFTLFYITSEARGCNESARKLSGFTDRYLDMINAAVNTGRFRGMKELVEYGLERLHNMDIGNPLAAYPLARELYEIMKHWPEAELEGLLDSALFPTGRHRVDEKGDEFSRQPLTQEELDDLYRSYNANPRQFLNSYGLTVYPELLDTGEFENTSAAQRGERIQEYLDEIMKTDESFTELDYTEPGTIDFSKRTKVDDIAALEQGGNKNDTLELIKDFIKKSRRKRKKIKKDPPGKKFVYSIDANTKSRTILSEIKEISINGADQLYLRKFRQWEYMAQRVYQQLAQMMPPLQEEHALSALEGDLNMEQLIEIMSDRTRIGVQEYLDVYKEGRRSLEAVIGLDASGSTDLITETDNNFFNCGATLSPVQKFKYNTILDVEKAFAMILGTALNYLTDRLEIYAFNSVTSTTVYRAENIKAISSFISDQSNRDGDFIRYINNKMQRSDADVKFFFLISDGKPDSVNYSGAQAMNDTLIAMRETVNSGVKLIYFNIDMLRGDYFNVFKKEATCAEHFCHPEDLLPAIPGMVRTVVESIK